MNPKRTSACFCPFVRCFWLDCGLLKLSERRVQGPKSYLLLEWIRRCGDRPLGTALRSRAPVPPPSQLAAPPHSHAPTKRIWEQSLPHGGVWALNPSAVGASPHPMCSLLRTGGLLSSLRPTQGAVSWSSALGPGVAGPQYLYLLRTPSSGQVEREGDYEIMTYCELNHPVNRRAECDTLLRHRWNSALKFFIRIFPRGGLCTVTNEGPALYTVDGGRGNPKRSQSLGCSKSEVGSGAGSCSQERSRLPPGAGRGNCKAFPACPPRPGQRHVKGRKKVSSVDGKLNFYSKTETFRKR